MMTWAEDKAIPARREPERRPRGQDRRVGGSKLVPPIFPFPFGIGTKR